MVEENEAFKKLGKHNLALGRYFLLVRAAPVYITTQYQLIPLITTPFFFLTPTTLPTMYSPTHCLPTSSSCYILTGNVQYDFLLSNRPKIVGVLPVCRSVCLSLPPLALPTLTPTPTLTRCSLSHISYHSSLSPHTISTPHFPPMQHHTHCYPMPHHTHCYAAKKKAPVASENSPAKSWSY